MKFTVFASLALAALVRAGNPVKPSTVVEIETVHIIEYTEICECPTTTSTVLPVPLITTISCCETCAPVTITATSQPVSSWTTCYTPTSTVCEETGVYLLGESFYPCNAAPCTIQYNQPHPTCYVCAYCDCWAPHADTNPKHVQVYEYSGDDYQVGYWEENWILKTWDDYMVKTKAFTQPTVFIENNITINVTVAPTVITYTQTSTVTSTATATITATAIPTSRPTVPSSVPYILASSTPPMPFSSSSVSASPSSTPGIDVSFVLDSIDHPGASIVVQDGQLAYSTTESSEIMHLSGDELFDSQGRVAYISDDDLTAGSTYVDFVTLSSKRDVSLPINSLTNVFSVDTDGNLVVTVNGIVLKPLLCNDSGVFIKFGYTTGACMEVILTTSKILPPLSSQPTFPSSATDIASSADFSFAPSSDFIPVTSAPLSVSPSSVTSTAASSAPSQASSVVNSDIPFSTPDPSSIPSLAPSDVPSSIASGAPSSIPSAPVPTYSYAMASASPGLPPYTINQGYGTSLTDTLYITVIAYDQFDNPFPGATFNIACDIYTGLYNFQTYPYGPNQANATSDINGRLQWLFSSRTVGNSFIITIMDQLFQVVASIPVTVLLVPDCSQEIQYVGSPIGALVIGRDVPSLSYSCLDIVGNWIPGVSVMFVELYPVPYTSVYTSGPFPILYPVSNTVGPAGNQTWQVQAGTCPPLQSAPLTWYWGVDCSASSISLSSNTPLTTDGLTVTGTIQPTPGASLVNSNVMLSLGETTVSVDVVDNSFTYTFSYDPSETGTIYVSLEFPDALSGCSIGDNSSAYSVTWTIPPNPPYCDQDYQSSLNISNLTPDVITTVGITLTARDVSGVVIPNLPWSFYSLSRADSPWAVTLNGTTDDDGSFSFNYFDDSWGPQDDIVQVTFGSGSNVCAKQQTISWQPL